MPTNTAGRRISEIFVINTHKGPGIFQRVMEGLLPGKPKVVAYTDDILVTGMTDKKHLQALTEVLTRLENVGFRVKKEKCAFMANQYWGTELILSITPSEGEGITKTLNIAELKG